MEINNLHLENQLEKILKPNIVWYTKTKQFQFNDVYIDDLEINYFKSEIEIFKNYLYYFKAENLLNSKSIKSIRNLFQKRLNLLKSDIKIYKKKNFIIKDVYCLSTNEPAPKNHKKINLDTYLQNPDFNDVLQCKFHHHIFSSISRGKFNSLLKDKVNGDFIIQNLKLQLILQLHYESLTDFIQFLDTILELDNSFNLTDFKSYFAPETSFNSLTKLEKKKCTLKMKNHEVVSFFYLMYLYDFMFIDRQSTSDKKRSDLQRFFEDNFMYLDKNGNPQNIVRFQSQLSKINKLNFEENKKEFINKLRVFLDEYEKTTTNVLLSNFNK